MSKWTGVIGAVGQYAEGEAVETAQQQLPSGVWGRADKSIGVWGQSDSHVGTLGQSGFIGLFGTTEPVDFSKFPAAGVHGHAHGDIVGVCGQSHAGPGVMGESALGIAVAAVTDDGVAIAASGPIHSSMAGNNMVPRRADSFFMECHEVTDRSHVTITFNADHRENHIWVERMPGKGFTLHLARRAHMALPFSFFVVDPLAPGELPVE